MELGQRIRAYRSAAGMTHLADGTYNRNGCLFIDCDNAGDFSDDNTIIYGHHMASGQMFASLTRQVRFYTGGDYATYQRSHRDLKHLCL